MDSEFILTLREWHATEAAGRGVVEVLLLEAMRPHERAAVEESFRWGEAQVLWQDDERFLLALALSLNQELRAGVFVRDIEVGEGDASAALRALTEYGRRLLAFAESHNQLNAALMAERRGRLRGERALAEAIHAWKQEQKAAIRSGFSHMEPELILAIRRGDRPEARRILNQLLMYGYNLGRGEFDRLREWFAELVSLMRSTVKACGVDPLAHPALTEPLWEVLARMEDEEELSPWLHRQLEAMIALIEASAAQPGRLRAKWVLDYMARNHARSLGRPEVAAKAGLSEAEFSRMLRRETGASFSEHLLRLRLDTACGLLRSSALTIAEIAQRSGFEEPAYFSRVFRRAMGRTAREYRASTGGSQRLA